MNMGMSMSPTSWWAMHLTLTTVVVFGLLSVAVWWWSTRARAPRVRLLVLMALTFLYWGSVFEQYALSDYSIHMAGHLIIFMVLAPLAASAISWRASALTATLGFVGITVLIPLYHLTRLGGYVMRHAVGHVSENLLFFLIGAVFWLPVYGRQSTFSALQRFAYVVLASPIAVTTGLVLWSATAQDAERYAMNMSMVSIADIHRGGLVMIELGCVAAAVHAAILGGFALRDHAHRRIPDGALR